MKYKCLIIHYIDKKTGGVVDMGYEFIHPKCADKEITEYDFQVLGTAVLDGDVIGSSWCYICNERFDEQK